MNSIFRAASALLLLVQLSGCSWMPFSIPFFDEKEAAPAPETTVQKKSGRESISPLVRELMADAGKYWTEAGECLEPEKAVALLDKAVNADPLDPAPYLLRSRALSDLGYLDDAFEDATKAVRLSPDAESYATRGLICLKQNHPQGAQRDFEYAERLDPKEPLIYIYRAAGAFLDGRQSDACDDLEKACELGRCMPWEKAKQDKVCR